MPKGIYTRTEEHNKKISKARKGHHISVRTEFKKGLIPWNIGQPLSDEHKKAISTGAKKAVNKGRYKVGHRPSMEVRNKIRFAHIGKKESEANKRKRGAIISAALKGKTLSESHRKNISLHHAKMNGKNNPMYDKRREKSPNWQGGISFLPYSIDWTETLRKAIRQRDNYVCQLCSKSQKKNGRKLSVHHIDYDKENCDPKNLVSLCVSCNTKVNLDRKHWMKFFKLKLKFA